MIQSMTLTFAGERLYWRDIYNKLYSMKLDGSDPKTENIKEKFRGIAFRGNDYITAYR